MRFSFPNWINIIVRKIYNVYFILFSLTKRRNMFVFWMTNISLFRRFFGIDLKNV